MTHRKLVALAALAAGLSSVPAQARPYHSPGYTGTKAFAKVGPRALPSVTLGTGKEPSLLVDAAGTAHVVYARDGGASAADGLVYCNLQRGLKSCASTGTAPGPTAPDASLGGAFSGNSPGINDDVDGPRPLVMGNQLFVVDRRFPDAFPTPGGGTSDSNVFEWSSNDGGATLTGPGLIGDNQMSGGAIAYGDANAPAIGTISRTETGGTFFQGSPAGQYTTAKAQLGTGDQAYFGALALDGTRPVATFADLSGNVFVREWSGQGDVNDASTWSTTSFHGFSPQIVGGAGGVFVLTSDDRNNGGRYSLRRIVDGQLSGASHDLGISASDPALSEAAGGALAYAYTDRYGVDVRTAVGGTSFSPPQLAAALAPGQGIDHLATAVTGDGGGFATFVKNPAGASAIGTVVASAFGTQTATHQPGLGPLPGGGVGSAAGDKLATSTCTTATFGKVKATIAPVGAGCYGHDPSNPNLDVSLGEVDLNGLRIIPDKGTRIGIDPRLHTIDTTGKVRVVLTAEGIDITLWHDELHARLPSAGIDDTLFDFKPKVPVLVQGFPIDGDIDVKLAGDGVDVPISLKLPGSLGGVSGQATLHATTGGGLDLKSLEFKVGDADLAAVELKDVDVTYTRAGNAWKGSGTLLVPSGGSAFSAALDVEFDDGRFKSGSLDVGLPYPGIPLDDVDTPPQVYLSHGGLGFGLDPITLSGQIGFGITPLLAPGTGSREDYAMRLEGQLEASFGDPITITVKAQGFLRSIELAHGTLVYKLPDQVTLQGSAGYDLGIIGYRGTIGAIFDPRNKTYGASIEAHLTFDGHTIPNSYAVAVNNDGFAVYIPPGVVPVPPFPFGTVSYHWGDATPDFAYGSNTTGDFTKGIPQAGGARAGRAHAAAATGFTVPRGAPSVSLQVHGQGGAPAVALTGPGGKTVAIDDKRGSGQHALVFSDAGRATTYVAILHPRAGRWTVAQGGAVPITSVEYAPGHAAPSGRGKLSGRGARRTLRYTLRVAKGMKVAFAERTKRFLHVVGHARGARGTLRFRPGAGPYGRRRLVAEVTSAGLPVRSLTLGAYSVPRPPRPGRARKLRVRAGRRSFSFSFRAPAHATRTLIRITASDGRRIHKLVPLRTRRGTLRLIGFGDRVTVAVLGLAADGRRGPAVKASAKARTPNTGLPKKKKKRKKKR